MTGKVWLVGAGPGDPGLITVNGREALEQAEVVIYDWVLPEAFLDYTAEGTETIATGSQPGPSADSQADINALLVEKAREGKRVVRLKGGDPFVFGLGGEEIAALRANNIPFDIINGVTAAIAAPTYAGIPITYGDLATSFAVMWGSDRPERPSSTVDWSRLATAVDTLVLMWATADLDHIAEQLIHHGRPATTPVAVVGWGTRTKQRTVVDTLAGIADRVRAAGIEPPAVTIVGDVVSLRDRLRWYDDRALFGRRVLVTRARGQAPELIRMLTDQGADVVELPTAEVAETTAPEVIGTVVKTLVEGHYSWVIFTSPGAVDRFFRHLDGHERDTRAFGSTRVCAIGTGTAERLADHGLRADAAPAAATGAAVVKELSQRPTGRRRILIPRAENLPPDLLPGLRRLGVEVEDLPLYVSSVPLSPNRESLARLREGDIDVVTFASASGVANLAQLLGGDLSSLHKPVIACMGPVTAEEVRRLGLTPTIIGEDRTIAGLVRAICAHYAAAGSEPAGSGAADSGRAKATEPAGGAR